eukprot:447670_1
MFSFVLWLYFISSALCTCNFKSQWTFEGNTLDLSTFQALGTNISGADSTYTYQFSAVNNLAYGYGNYYSGYRNMLTQFQNGTPTGLHYVLNSLDPIKPTVSFNNNNNIEWNFDYTSNISIKYICDPQGSTQPPYMEFTKILELIPGIFLFEVSSLYFCPNKILPITMAQNQCIWTDDSNLYTLNLTSLFGTTITVKNKNYPNNDFFFYTICADNTTNSNSNGNYIPCGMNTIIPDQYGTAPNLYTFWNSSVQPSYNVISDSWTFIYDVVLTGNSYIPTQMIIEWICDSNIDPYRVENVGIVKYSSNQYVKSLSISSRYVCNSECNFKTNGGDDNTLDLQALSGKEIYGIADDLSYSIIYTPCSNSVDCNDKDVMAMKWDVENRVCKDYLAVFTGCTFNGYNLTFDEMAQQWHFVYTNGEYCQKGKEMFNLYWRCNVSSTSWAVTKVEANNECEYSMYIDSKYAC